ncbi:hypothetical protein ACIQRE_01705 [Streptomyces griseoluteus]|uniref:hypothetical protein n=1 Tax=Streptomyces griseoluteus TaxID=29306 RepID=UPI00381EE5E4
MTDRTVLGDRIRRHEAAYRAVLPRHTDTVIRVDGRAFHTPAPAAQVTDAVELVAHITHSVAGGVEVYHLSRLALQARHMDEVSAALDRRGSGDHSTRPQQG